MMASEKPSTTVHIYVEHLFLRSCRDLCATMHPTLVSTFATLTRHSFKGRSDEAPFRYVYLVSEPEASLTKIAYRRIVLQPHCYVPRRT